MGRQEPDNLVHVNPDLRVALLLALVEDQFHAEVQMNGLNVVHVLLIGVAGAAHEADEISRLHHIPLCQPRSEGCVLLQMSIIIVSFTIKGANSNPPTAIAVPAHGLYHAPLHRHNGGAQGAHHIMAQVLALKAEGAADPEVIAMPVAIPGGNGRKSLQAIACHPDPVLFDGVAAHQSPQSGGVSLVIVVVVLVEASQQFLGRLVPRQILGRLLHCGQAAFSARPAGRQGQHINPRQVLFLFRRGNVPVQGVFQ